MLILHSRSKTSALKINEMTTHKHGSLSFASIISALSIALYCAGFLRIELELNEQKRRINALENVAEKRLPTKVDQNLRKLMDDVPGG